MLHQLLIKYYQTVTAQKLVLRFKTWQNEAIGKVLLLLPGSSQIVGALPLCFAPSFKGKNVEKNYPHGRKFEREESLTGVRWATICISSPQSVFVTMQFLWGAWLSAWNLWCIVLEVATTNTRCLHLAELNVLQRKAALPGKVEAAFLSLVLSAAAWWAQRGWLGVGGGGSSFLAECAGRAYLLRSRL